MKVAKGKIRWFIFALALLLCALLPLTIVINSHLTVALILLAPILVAAIVYRIDPPPWPFRSRSEAKRASFVATLAKFRDADAGVHMVMGGKTDWRQPDRVERFTGELAALGFVKIGDYVIPGRAGQYRREFCHPSENLLAMIAQGDDHTWLGIYVLLENETVVWCSTRPICPVAHPWLTQLDADSDSAASLRDLLLRHVGDQPRSPFDLAEFSRTPEPFSRELSEWVAAHGPTTRDVLAYIRKQQSKPWSDAYFNQLVLLCHRQNLATLEQMLMRYFYESGQITPERTEALGGGFFLVHDRMEKEDVPWPPCAIEPANIVPIGVTSMREAFRIVNATLPESDRDRLIGSVEKPIPADLYERPAHVAGQPESV